MTADKYYLRHTQKQVANKVAKNIKGEKLKPKLPQNSLYNILILIISIFVKQEKFLNNVEEIKKLATNWHLKIPVSIIDFNLKKESRLKIQNKHNIAIIDIEGPYDNPIEIAIIITNPINYNLISHFHTLIKNDNLS